MRTGVRRAITVPLLCAALAVAIWFMPDADAPTAAPRREPTAKVSGAPDCSVPRRLVDVGALFAAIGSTLGVPSARAEQPRSRASACRDEPAPSGSR